MKLHNSLRSFTEGVRHVSLVTRETEGCEKAHWKLHQAEELLREAVAIIEAEAPRKIGPNVRWTYGMGR